jgi:type I restriction enzyme S subunit
VRPYKDRILPHFFFRYLQSSFSRAQVLAMTKRVTISGIDSQQLKALTVVVPSLAEQESILLYVNAKDAEFDSLIGKIQEAVDHLKEYRTALISAAVTGKIDVREEVA